MGFVVLSVWVLGFLGSGLRVFVYLGFGLGFVGSGLWFLVFLWVGFWVWVCGFWGFGF